MCLSVRSSVRQACRKVSQKWSKRSKQTCDLVNSTRRGLRANLWPFRSRAQMLKNAIAVGVSYGHLGRIRERSRRLLSHRACSSERTRPICRPVRSMSSFLHPWPPEMRPKVAQSSEQASQSSEILRPTDRSLARSDSEPNSILQIRRLVDEPDHAHSPEQSTERPVCCPNSRHAHDSRGFECAAFVCLRVTRSVDCGPSIDCFGSSPRRRTRRPANGRKPKPKPRKAEKACETKRERNKSNRFEPAADCATSGPRILERATAKLGLRCSGLPAPDAELCRALLSYVEPARHLHLRLSSRWPRVVWLVWLVVLVVLAARRAAPTGKPTSVRQRHRPTRPNESLELGQAPSHRAAQSKEFR